MIVVENKIGSLVCSKLHLFAKKINVLDWFKIVSYNVFYGNKIPPFFFTEYKLTVLQSLEKGDDELMNDAKSNTRNEIRRGIKDGNYFCANVDIQDFVVFYNQFAKEKKLSIIKMADCLKYSDTLYITKVMSEGTILAMHATVYDRDEGVVRLLYSASSRLISNVDSKQIGVGNRFLHFKDFIYFREIGAKIYDWGGIYKGTKDKSQIGIAQFKKGFGGEETHYVCIYSPLYYILVKLRTFKILFHD